MTKARDIADLGAVTSRLDTVGASDGALSNRNLIINGAMQVAQRGTSATGITGTGYHAVDRFSTDLTTLGTWSISQSTDAPDGFAYSLLHSCTTADASPAAGDTFRLSYRFEGQDLQHLQKGTSSAKDCTLSFWIKSNKTGTGQFNIRDIDNTRGINKTYTIDAADTWEYKTITIQGDTTGSISNDNGSSFWLMWLFNSGTNNSSGTFNSDWHTWDWTDINAAGTLDIGASTSDYVKITGVQLEVGDTATPFEHRSYGDELARCQRYYYRAADGSGNTLGIGVNYTPSWMHGVIYFPVTMRAIPTLSAASGTNYYEFIRNGAADFFNSLSLGNRTTTKIAEIENTTEISGTVGHGGFIRTDNSAVYVDFDAEL